MISGLRAPKIAKGFLRPPEAQPEPRSAACLNCGAPLAGPFCAQCGQRDIPPYPSVKELVTDAFWELSGWDGRFAGTVRALVAAPGKLTTEFLEGRRVRYVSPLRLYLVASLVYFLAAAAAPELRRGQVEAGGIQIGVTKSGPKRVAAASADAREGTITAEERAAALKEIERAPAVMRPVLRRAVVDPKGFKRGMLEAMPRMLFALVPVFAAIVALFYRRRKYPEHLYFSLHLHAFIFVALSVAEAAKLARSIALAEGVGVVVGIGILVYGLLALRKVYGDSIGRTIAKSVGIGALYVLASGVAMLGLVYWAALFT